LNLREQCVIMHAGDDVLKKIFNLNAGRQIKIGGKTLVVGILNFTPDSFSDGGKYFSVDAATAHVAQLIEYGADVIDVGAESTRPGATPISVEEEIARLEKVLPAVRVFGVPISIDTYKPEVAEYTLRTGADMINDVHGLEDSRMIDVVKKFNAPIIAMHNEKCSDGDIIEDIKNFFRRTLEHCVAKNFDTSKIIFDPGIGFSKTPAEDLEIMRRFDELKTLDGKEIILTVGVSRKSFIGRLTGFKLDQRDEATGALCVDAITKGVDLVRVHNVKLVARMCSMTDVLYRKKARINRLFPKRI